MFQKIMRTYARYREGVDSLQKVEEVGKLSASNVEEKAITLRLVHLAVDLSQESQFAVIIVDR